MNKHLLPKNKGVVIYPATKAHCNVSYRAIQDIKEPIKFGRISAFCPSKKIIDTVECAKLFPNAEFIIAGTIQDRSYYKYIANKIQKEKIENIKMRTDVSLSQKQDILNAVNIWHYPTSNEAFCFSILEAMDNSLPIISYNNGAIPEFIENVSPHGFNLCKDFYEMVEQTGKLIDEASMSVGKEYLIKAGEYNQKIVRLKYGIENYHSQIEKIYNG